MRAFDRELIRGGHYGQRSCVPRKQAEHMAAPTNAAKREENPCQPGAVHTSHCILRNSGYRLGDERLSEAARMGGEVVSDFLAGGGEMGALTRGYDWSKTSLGPPEQWPQSLRVTVRLVLTSRHPMFIWWGPELIQFYNDAYRETMGPERHPSALGARGSDCWAEI